MEQNCKECGTGFQVTESERLLLERLSAWVIRLLDGESRAALPAPSLCPDCRQQRRLAMRNQRKLFPRKCDLCGKHMVCLYSADKPFKIFCTGCYWGDGWSAASEARDYDPAKPFLPQLKELWRAVPKLGLVILGENENSQYTNDNYRLKNCYLVFDGEQSIDCCYGETFSHLKDCYDFFCIQHCELCYECINCTGCYELFFSRACHNCSSSWFLMDCIGCKNCFGCVNLTHKEYCFFNEQLTPEEYRSRFQELDLGGHSSLTAVKERAEEHFAKYPKKWQRGVRNEGVSGDNLNGCKDCFDSFDCAECRDCGYSTNLLMGANDSLDHNMWGDGTNLVYNSVAVGASADNILCCYYVYQSVHSVAYSMLCSRGSNNLFGCVGLRRTEHAILNQKLSVHDYKKAVGSIVGELRDQGIWGEYFPKEFPDFGYNETVAQEYYPLRKSAALAQGFSWSDSETQLSGGKAVDASALPDSIDDTPEEILKSSISCAQTGKPFRLQRKELKFYLRYRLPIPRIHPDRRHTERLALSLPRALWERSCSRCKKPLRSNHHPAKSDQVYCTECFAVEFYA